MTEQDVEAVLRRQYAADADEAPHPAALADGARRLAGRQRRDLRRRVGVGGLLLAAAAGAGVAVVGPSWSRGGGAVQVHAARTTVRPGPTLVVSTWTNGMGGMEALGHFRLEVTAEGCVVGAVQGTGATPRRTLLVWPAGYRARWGPQGAEIVDPQGRVALHEGDDFSSAGGGGASRTLDIPGPCRTYSENASSIQDVPRIVRASVPTPTPQDLGAASIAHRALGSTLASASQGVRVTSAAYVVTTIAAWEAASADDRGTLTSSGHAGSQPIVVVKLFGAFPAAMHSLPGGVPAGSVPASDTLVRVVELATGQTLSSGWSTTGDLGDTTGAGGGVDRSRSSSDLRLLGVPMVLRVPACTGEGSDLRPEYAGLPLVDATRLARSKGLQSRTATLDGRLLVLSADHRSDRVEFDVEGGRLAGPTDAYGRPTGGVVGGTVVCASIG